MGPNARRWPKLDGELPELTHKDVDKLLRPDRRKARRRPAERWIIKTRFYSGDPAYWGYRRDGSPGLTPHLSNAIKYESEPDALYHGYTNKEARRHGDFEVEQLPPIGCTPGSSGTGGRA